MILINDTVSPLKNSIPTSLQIILLDHAQLSFGTTCLTLDGQLPGERNYKRETQALCCDHSRAYIGWKPSFFSGVPSTTRWERGCPSLCVPTQSCLLKDQALVSFSAFSLFTQSPKSNNQHVAF